MLEEPLGQIRHKESSGCYPCEHEAGARGERCEVEVTEKRRTGNPANPIEIIRLGYLSDGAFFGEAPLLAKTETAFEIRMRTVTAIRDCEVCYLRREDVHALYSAYPELAAR